MTKQHFHVLLEWDSEAGAWVTYVPMLNGLSTFGQSREEALAKTREAILGYLEAAEKEGIPLPEPAEMVDVGLPVPLRIRTVVTRLCTYLRDDGRIERIRR